MWTPKSQSNRRSASTGAHHQKFFNWDDAALPAGAPELTPKIQSALLLIFADDSGSAVRNAALDRRCNASMGDVLVSTAPVENEKDVRAAIDLCQRSSGKIVLVVDCDHYSAEQLELLKMLRKEYKYEVQVLLFTRDGAYNTRDPELAAVLDDFPRRQVRLKAQNDSSNSKRTFFTAIQHIRAALRE